MNPQELKDTLLGILKEKKVEDLTVIDVAKQTEIADYMIIMTGRNNTHVRTLSEFIEEEAEKRGIYAIRKEGVREGRWIVIDYASVIVHIFNKEMRGYFALEQLWENGDNITKIEADDGKQ